MAKKITINGKDYELPIINFRAVRQLEKNGLDFNNIEEEVFSSLSALVALTINADLETADKEIEEHAEKNNTIEDIANILFERLQNSDFFRNISKQQQSK